MSEFGVDVESRDGVGWVVLRNPGKLNAVRLEMWEAIPRAVAGLVGDSAVRVIVLRGHGEDAFASGADISEFVTHRKDAASARAYEGVTARAFAALLACEKPLVAMVQGTCIGGGLAIAICADLRIAADDTKMALPPARLGLGYHVAGVARVVEVVGPSAAAEMFFTARVYDAAEALAIGLVNRVVPKPELRSATEAYVAPSSRTRR
jgi:enoyl-CoA hydratase/carnithine racemase